MNEGIGWLVGEMRYKKKVGGGGGDIYKRLLSKNITIMGVHYLSRHNEHVNARLPLKITFNADLQLETDLYFLKDYEQIGHGRLKSIGIDGSVFIHSHIIAESKQLADGKASFNVYVNKSATEISTKIVEYVKIVLHFFELMNPQYHHHNPADDNNVLIHVVIDGKPPVSKNRRDQTLDAYSQMNKNDKKELHDKLMVMLNQKIIDLSTNTTTNLILLSNKNEKNRGEGELELYSVCKKINKKYQFQNDVKNVIVSPDSDLIALMALEKDAQLVIISPTRNGIYITNLQLMLKGLQLNADEFIKYVVLHFIFFGSDYNAGLMTNPTESKQTVLYQAVKNGCDDINKIARGCLRKLNKEAKERLRGTSSEYLTELKEDLVIEAICSMRYYKSLGDKSHLTDFSPFIYQKPDSRGCVPLLSF